MARESCFYDGKIKVSLKYNVCVARKRKLYQANFRTKAPVEIIRYRPGISEIGAPQGFRVIPMAQAMMEYAKPLVELVQAKNRNINEALQIFVLL